MKKLIIFIVLLLIPFGIYGQTAQPCKVPKERADYLALTPENKSLYWQKHIVSALSSDKTWTKEQI